MRTPDSLLSRGRRCLASTIALDCMTGHHIIYTISGHEHRETLPAVLRLIRTLWRICRGRRRVARLRAGVISDSDDQLGRWVSDAPLYAWTVGSYLLTARTGLSSSISGSTEGTDRPRVTDDDTSAVRLQGGTFAG